MTPETLTAVRARLNAARVEMGQIDTANFDEQAVRASLADTSELLSEVERLRNRERRLIGSIKHLVELSVAAGVGARDLAGDDLREHLLNIHLDESDMNETVDVLEQQKGDYPEVFATVAADWALSRGFDEGLQWRNEKGEHILLCLEADPTVERIQVEAGGSFGSLSETWAFRFSDSSLLWADSDLLFWGVALSISPSGNVWIDPITEHRLCVPQQPAALPSIADVVGKN